MQCSQLWFVSYEVADWQSYNKVVVFLAGRSSLVHLSKKSSTLLLLIRILTTEAVLLRPTGDFHFPSVLRHMFGLNYLIFFLRKRTYFKTLRSLEPKSRNECVRRKMISYGSLGFPLCVL